MNKQAVGPIAWAGLLIPTWIVLVLCTHWEPVMRDSWGHFMWHRNTGLSLDNLWDFARGSYVHNNPRLGQVLTLLVFTPGPWHEIVTPLVELSLFWLLTALVLGRWPSLRRADDALLAATILAMICVSSPLIGPMLFYRPFTGNYLFGLVLNLLLLIPYRFHFEREGRGAWWWAPALLVLGVLAGLCNEHTGPTIAAMALVAIVACVRRGERPPVWMIAGVIGLVAGGIALFVAPGQHIRYNGLATQQGMVERILSRGVLKDLRIVLEPYVYALPVIVWLAIGLIARRRGGAAAVSRARRITELVLVAASLTIMLTLLVSPKQGPRLYFAAQLFAIAGAAGWVVATLADKRARIAVAGLAGAVLLYVGIRCVHAYHVLGPENRARIAALEAAPPNSGLVVPHYSLGKSRWNLGDDLDVPEVRNHVAFAFKLALLTLEGQHATPTPAGADEP